MPFHQYGHIITLHIFVQKEQFHNRDKGSIVPPHLPEFNLALQCMDNFINDTVISLLVQLSTYM